MLREGDDDPERRVEVVDVDEEGRVLFDAEDEVVLRESVLKHGAVLIEKHLLLLPIASAGWCVTYCEIHLDKKIVK